MTKGLYITFEGGEGCGKDTQLARAQKNFSETYEIKVTREPGGTAAGEQIRNILLQSAGLGTDHLTPMAELCLFYAARSVQYVDLKRDLAAGVNIFSGRSIHSSRVYQGYARGISLEDIETINQIVVKDFKPDMTILYDLSHELGVSRARKRNAQTGSVEKRFDDLPLEFHQKVREGYLDLARKNPGHFKIIDVSVKSIEEVEEETTAFLSSYLQENYR